MKKRFALLSKGANAGSSSCKIARWRREKTFACCTIQRPKRANDGLPMSYQALPMTLVLINLSNAGRMLETYCTYQHG